VRTVEEWKLAIRVRLREALGAGDRPIASVLRETLAAIENAEAPSPHDVVARTPDRSDDGPFAASVRGLGAGEVERVRLDPEAVRAIVDREIRDGREAAAEYSRVGRDAEARQLDAQVRTLLELVTEGGG
jgi:uncharacterized protein YqeY